MALREVIILAVLQGITEFLPVSSSGHLVVVQHLLGLNNVPVLFDLVLHVGTVLATIIVYYRVLYGVVSDLLVYPFRSRKERRIIARRKNLRLLLCIIISTGVTGLIGALFKEEISGLFYKPEYIPFFFAFTGVLLISTRVAPVRDRSVTEVGIPTALGVGAVQSVAMIPGVSRSGATISAGLFMGLSRESAGTYSFLVSIPSIIGAWIGEWALDAGAVAESSGESLASASLQTWTYVTGFLLAVISGWLSLRLLLRFLKRGRLHIFSYYCFAVAAAVFWLNGTYGLFS